MIKSPCKTCRNIHLPKHSCSKNCRTLKQIQDHQSLRYEDPSIGVDHADIERYSIYPRLGFYDF